MSSRSRPRRVVTQEVLSAGRVLSNAAVMFHSVLAGKQGLSAIEEKAIDLLDRFGPLTAGELGDKSALAPASITGLVDRLEKKGFVKRVPDAADGRRVRIQMRPESLAAFAPLFTDLVEQMESLCAKYSVEDLETIAAFMNEAARRQHECAARLTNADAAEPVTESKRDKR
jgi:DNA-binding MarR family transcriptional regulator